MFLVILCRRSRCEKLSVEVKCPQGQLGLFAKLSRVGSALVGAILINDTLHNTFTASRISFGHIYIYIFSLY